MKRKDRNILIGILTIGAIILLVIIFLIIRSIVDKGQTVNKGDISDTEQNWTITQWGDWEDSAQSMFYTIEDNKGNLTLIDGGYEKDTDKVRALIKEKGGHVKNWILTHPHPDHIQVFNEIYKDLQGIEIEHIYAPYVNFKIYQKKAKAWDDFNTFECFDELAEDMPQLQYLKEGDNRNIMGLNMLILNACNEEIEQYDSDIGNDCGLAFKISGKQESMLFLADLGKDREQHLLGKYHDLLKADYLQMGHHGNSSLSETVYKAIAPRTAFFDAPKFLMEGTEERFTTPHYKTVMEDMGADIKSFQSAPNTITLN